MYVVVVSSLHGSSAPKCFSLHTNNTTPVKINTVHHVVIHLSFLTWTIRLHCESGAIRLPHTVHVIVVSKLCATNPQKKEVSKYNIINCISVEVSSGHTCLFQTNMSPVSASQSLTNKIYHRKMAQKKKSTTPSLVKTHGM